MVDIANTYSASGQIDPISNMKDRPVFVYSGTADYIVENQVIKKTKSQFEDFFESNMMYLESDGGHVFPSTLPANRKTPSCNDGVGAKYRNCNIDLVG